MLTVARYWSSSKHSFSSKKAKKNKFVSSSYIWPLLSTSLCNSFSLHFSNEIYLKHTPTWNPIKTTTKKNQKTLPNSLIKPLKIPTELHVGEPMMSGGRYSAAREEKVVIVAQIVTTRPHSSQQQQQPERPLGGGVRPHLGRVLSLSLCSNIWDWGHQSSSS